MNVKKLASTTTKSTQQRFSATWMYDRRLDPEFSPVYFVCTSSEVLAMADKNGIHHPKNRPQPTPESVKALIKEFNNLNKAS